MKMHNKHPKDYINHVTHKEALKKLVFLILASKLPHPKGDGHYEHQTTPKFSLE